MTDRTTPRVGVVGLGNMGTAIANLVAVNGHDVIGWEYNLWSVIHGRYEPERFIYSFIRNFVD